MQFRCPNQKKVATTLEKFRFTTGCEYGGQKNGNVTRTIVCPFSTSTGPLIIGMKRLSKNVVRKDPESIFRCPDPQSMAPNPNKKKFLCKLKIYGNRLTGPYNCQNSGSPDSYMVKLMAMRRPSQWRCCVTHGLKTFFENANGRGTNATRVSLRGWYASRIRSNEQLWDDRRRCATDRYTKIGVGPGSAANKKKIKSVGLVAKPRRFGSHAG